MKRDDAGRFLPKHGLSSTRQYHIWEGMLARCYRPSCNGFPKYGGRGVSVCSKWRTSFEGFWEDMGENYESNLTLDRINPEGDYCKENCRWVSYKTQSRNKENNVFVEIGGLTLCLQDWKIHFGLTNSMVYKRFERGELGYDLIRPKYHVITEGSDYGLSGQIEKLKSKLDLT